MAAAASPDPVAPVRVLLLENVSPTALDVFGAEGFQVETIGQALSPAALAQKLARGTVDVLGIRSKTRVPADVLAQASSLLAIGCFCIGTDQVDLDEANHRGIPVFNAPFSNTRSVAELMIAEIISLSRQLGDRTREVAGGTWKKVAAGCYEVRGKTLGIVGYGHIGRQLGVLAEGLGMRVFFHDHTPKLPMGNNVAVPTLRELLAMADFVSLHVPDTKQTRNMIGAAELATMKQGSYLLNASRGTVVVIPALAAALHSGHLAGAAVDVYPEEPETSGEGFHTALQGLPNVLLTPHIGGSTSEAQAAIGREVSTVLTKFVRTGATRGSVNFPQVEPQAQQGAGRILNVHRNVPGVLRDINKIVSDLQANIRSQVLATDQEIGYLVIDIDIDRDAHDVTVDVNRGIAALPTNIRTRIV